MITTGPDDWSLPGCNEPLVTSTLIFTDDINNLRDLGARMASSPVTHTRTHAHEAPRRRKMYFV